MTAQLAATRAYRAIPLPDYTEQTLTAFAVRIRLGISMIAEMKSWQAGTYDSKVWSVAGDSYGVIQAFDPSPISEFLCVPEHTFQHSSPREYQLDSQVGAYENTWAES
jgi:hypothetical protein